MSKTILTYTEKSLGSISIFHLNGNILGDQDTSELCRNCVEARINGVGHVIDLGVGDHIDLERMNNND